MILNVQPRVNPGGLVYMNIGQQVSQVDTSVGHCVNGNPTISQRELATQVAVQSGQTVLLGGLIQQDEGTTDTGVPGLNRIPMLGRLFGSTDRNRNRTELIVLITPRVIRGSDGRQADHRRVPAEVRIAGAAARSRRNAGGTSVPVSAVAGARRRHRRRAGPSSCSSTPRRRCSSRDFANAQDLAHAVVAAGNASRRSCASATGR